MVVLSLQWGAGSTLQGGCLKPIELFQEHYQWMIAAQYLFDKKSIGDRLLQMLSIGECAG